MKLKNRFNLPSRKIIPENEARQLLQPHFDRLFLCVRGAWESWEKLGQLAPECKKPLDSTARANFIWCTVKENVKKSFKKISGISILEKGRLFALDIHGVALIRFKKLDSNFRARNVVTKRQLELQMQIQSQNVSLPGMDDEATWLTCGYILDDHEVVIESYVVTCFVGSIRKFVIPFGTGNVISEETIASTQRTAGKAKVLPMKSDKEAKKSEAS